jgi:hypothetical protein
MKILSLRWAVILFVIVLVAIQFIPIDKSIPDYDPANDFFVVKNPPRRIIASIKTSCYDCHSYKTVYPWYSRVAPVSWLLQSHISEGRESLNFSLFGQYTREEANHALSEIREHIEKDEMPLKSYTMIHKQAKLTEEMKEDLLSWLSTGKNEIEEP